MTTVTKSAAAPFSTTAYTNAALTATATPQISSTVDAAFKMVSTYKVYILGETDAAKEPTKSMTTWVSSSAAARKSGAVDVSSNVSSYAIIVDIATKKLFLEKPPFCGTATGADQVNTTSAPLTTCTVGAIGNSIAFWIGNGTTTTTTIAGFRMARKVLTNGATGVPATFSHVYESLSASIATPPTDWKAQTVFNTGGKITFTGSALTCDVAKWDSATACNGVDMPWANTALVEWNATGPVLGSLRVWHFLAEKNADVTKNFQIEKDNKINWLIEERDETIAGATTSMAVTVT